ncbi:MAG TPA: F0F1 ATP synthase subunit A [Burkholderiaceae bacterium]|jgi:F-type H+-transporting ATPase subunit a|nr:F0F1 ATP synthase subunit A [Burkholderiaceae bacterium]
MSAESAAANGPTAGEYIVHHLQHWQNRPMKGVIDFGVVNIDSVIWSVLLGVVGCWLLYRAARSATSGVPGRFQAAVEILVEFVDNQAKGLVHNAQSRKIVAPLALTVFLWIFLMNSMDFLPVDLFHKLFAWTNLDHSIHYFRVVPTADLSTTLGLSISVLFVCIFYNMKIKGVGGWVHELFTAPFGDKWFLYPFNFIMQMIEFAAKTVSHGMRLFGNMYAGELIFMLIALMGGAFAASVSGILLPVGHVIAGSVWAIFHILIVGLQAFVFMMLTLVYVGQAHDAH